MIELLRHLVWRVARFVLGLRYRVRLHGGEVLPSLKGPVLLLPNHPAYVDPVLFLITFFPTVRPRIVYSEGNFPSAVVGPLTKLLDAIPIPPLTQQSQEARFGAERAIQEAIAALRRGENVGLWPSGRAQRDGVERLGPASALTEILRAVPEAKVVLVRTQGLWGSSFSYARTGKAPPLGLRLVQGAGRLLANLIFLMPRRLVEITVEPIDRSALPPLERDAVNRWFEDRYNVEGPEPPTYVPYHFLFGPRQHVFPALPRPEGSDLDIQRVPREVRQEVFALLSGGADGGRAEEGRRTFDPRTVRSTTRLADLGFDSLERMDLVLAVERQFGGIAAESPETVGQLMALAQRQGAEDERTAQAVADLWFRPSAAVRPPHVLAESIPEAFVARALATPRDVAAADDLSGVMTYEKLLVGTLVMARHFKRLPGARVGLMLPASVAADLMALGLSLANKVPVLLNWTTGPANLNHAVRLTGVTHVITSRNLRDRLGIRIEGVEFVDVEDLRRQTGWARRLWTLLTVRLAPQSIRRTIPRPARDDVAAILFTSGSEKAPKAVPLTQRNILHNLRAVPAVLDLTNRDALVGFLPMFHAFGFTLAGLFPLLCGVRVVHHPDPTDVAGLIRKIARYRPTLLVGMPTLVGQILERSRPGDLDSLTQIVVGAEKCPESLFEKAERLAPGATLLEAYGVTECSPGICANTRTASRRGTIGRPVPEVEVRVIDLETHEALPPGRMGMLLVHGPNVFPGYLGEETSPFVEREGKRWYRTGDLVELDSGGYIHFHGRLKRFIKVAGEMVSLPALEDPLANRYPSDENGPRVAVEGIDQGTGPRGKIVLFTTEPIALQEANRLLADAGFHGIMRIDEVRPVDQIPVLGNGKADYKRLRALIADSMSPSDRAEVIEATSPPGGTGSTDLIERTVAPARKGIRP